MRDNGKSSGTIKKKNLLELPRSYDTGRRWIKSISSKFWIWELGSLLLSTLCVVAILILMLQFDGQPIPSWGYGITINGVISVLAVIAKSALILPVAEAISQLKWHWYWSNHRPLLDFDFLDAASRGPLGCLRLLSRPKQWSVASLGATITVMALLMEPFLQLMPTYLTQKIDSSTASIPRSVFYMDYYSNPTGFGADYRLGGKTKTAFLGAIYGSTTRNEDDTLPVCPTGNCTWPSFTSLAVCSSCTNLSSIFRHQQGAPDPEHPYPNGVYYISTDHGGYWLDDMYADGQSAYPPVSKTYSPITNQTILDMIYMSQVLKDGLMVQQQAFECVMYFCTKTYSAKMENGKLYEQVTSFWPDVSETLPNEPPIPLVEPPVTPSSFDIRNYTVKPPDQETVYVVDSLTFWLIRQWLENIVKTMYYSLVTTTTLGDLGELFYNAQKVDINGSTHLSGPAPILERAAELMTSNIRNSAESAYDAIGVGTTLQTYVKVRWWACALPLLVLASTMAFVATTIILSVRNDIPVWKSSSLAVLAHGLDEIASQNIAAKQLIDVESKSQQYTMVMTDHVSRQKLRGALVK